MGPFRYFLKEALLNVRGNAVSTIIATATIALTMMLFGLFLLTYLNLTDLVGSIRQEIKIILYLKDGVGEKGIASLRKKLEEQVGVARVAFTSKEQALKEFRESVAGNDLLLKGLGENPLPASFELTPDKAFQSSKAVGRLAEQFENMDGVDHIQYGREWVENVNAFLGALRIASTVGGLILGLTAVVIISGTIGLTVWARLADIEVLKLIGATRSYIQMPFLLEGAFMGLIGGGISILLLGGLFFLAESRLGELAGLLGGGWTIHFLPRAWIGLFIAIGVGLGFTGSYISIRRWV